MFNSLLARLYILPNLLKAGTSDDKWMTPARTKQMIEGNDEIGSMKLSTKNLEDESKGAWIQCDGRHIKKSSYSKLSDTLKFRYGYNWNHVSSGPALYYESIGSSYNEVIKIYTPSYEKDIYCLTGNINSNSVNNLYVFSQTGQHKTSLTNISLSDCYVSLAVPGKNCIYTIGRQRGRTSDLDRGIIDKYTSIQRTRIHEEAYGSVFTGADCTIINNKAYVAGVSSRYDNADPKVNIITIDLNSEAISVLKTAVESSNTKNIFILGDYIYVADTKKRINLQTGQVSDLTNTSFTSAISTVSGTFSHSPNRMIAVEQHTHSDSKLLYITLSGAIPTASLLDVTLSDGGSAANLDIAVRFQDNVPYFFRFVGNTQYQSGVMNKNEVLLSAPITFNQGGNVYRYPSVSWPNIDADKVMSVNTNYICQFSSPDTSTQKIPTYMGGVCEFNPLYIRAL